MGKSLPSWRGYSHWGLAAAISSTSLRTELAFWGLKELVQAVYQHEGMVDKFVGGCIMAVFGAPVALEDDAERALRAALSMRESL